MDVAIVGGTGAEGFGLTLRLAKAGHHVTIGSRVAKKAAGSAEEARGLLGADATVDGAVNAESVTGKAVVFVTVPFEGQALIYDAIKDAVGPDTVVCDCTSPLMSAVGGGGGRAPPPRPPAGGAPPARGRRPRLDSVEVYPAVLEPISAGSPRFAQNECADAPAHADDRPVT
jgi:NAD(P)-dependent dehydrogenase (short-subunit alcohol dehydrogenase family)